MSLYDEAYEHYREECLGIAASSNARFDKAVEEEYKKAFIRALNYALKNKERELEEQTAKLWECEKEHVRLSIQLICSGR